MELPASTLHLEPPRVFHVEIVGLDKSFPPRTTVKMGQMAVCFTTFLSEGFAATLIGI